MASTYSSRQSHPHAGPSNYQSSVPSPVSPPPRPTHVQAIHDFDHSLLASANANTAVTNLYLSFKGGEIIKVHNREGNGWWDGEISRVGDDAKKGPRRGWFPSNYVREMGFDGSLHRREESATSNPQTSPRSVRKDPLAHSRHTSAASHMTHASQASSHISHTSHASTASRISQASHLSQHSQGSSTSYAPSYSARSPSLLPLKFQNILHPVVQSLSLLETAIHSRRAHIQPATAVVISSVRAALLGAHCLAKDSELLVQYPALQKDRKMVLVELSKLVNVAKGINPAEGVEDDDNYDPKQLESLAKSARAVFASMKRFLHKASDLGIDPVMVDEDGNIDTSGDLESVEGVAGPSSPVRPPSLQHETARQSRIRTPTNTGNARIQEAFKMRAASISDLRAARRRASSPPPPMPSTAGLINRARSPSIVTTPVSAGFSSGSGRSSPISLRSLHDRRSMNGDIETPLPTPPIPSPRDFHTTPDVYDAISDAEDALLSVIAAFIGHIHSHHATSHPSSHALLIEMTKETIDSVRDLLTVVEAVGRNGGIRGMKPREVDNLRVAKDNLYDVASRLVQGAEDVANMALEEGEEEYEKAKSRLLQSATGTLRAGTECVRLVKLCVPDGDITATPRQVVEPVRHSTPRPGQDGAVVLRDKVVGQRGVHTLSGLHRKASSLSLLQKRYQGEGMVTATEEAAEEEEEEDEEVVEDVTQEDETVRVPVTIPFPVPARNTPIRPSLLHVHTTPVPPAPKSAGLLRTFSDDNTIPRSRSSSLSSPAPPIRRAHRSPSRSADLDKFTSSDFSIPRSSPLSENQRHSAYTSGSGTTETTHSSINDPQTPNIANLSLDILDTGLGVGVGVGGGLDKTRSMGMDRIGAPPVDARFWVVAHDYDPREIAFNSDGAMVGASLGVLVEKMTPHDGPVDPIFWAGFFFTFRLFTTPGKLLNAIIARYDLQPPQSMSGGERDRAMWIERKVVPVRLRIYNFLKAWLDTHWRGDTDDIILATLRDFAADVVQRTLPAMSPRLLESIKKRSSTHTQTPTSTSRAIKRMSSSSDKLRTHIGLIPPPTTLPPTPIISKSLNTMLQKNPTSLSIPITEFDTMELARQLTIMESKLFCSVVPEELLLTGRKGVVELKRLSTLSNQITGWVADGILNEFDQKKRTLLLKFYIKLADKCLMLNNFSTLFAAIAGLNSSTVARLKKTWDALPSKYRVIMDRLNGIVEHTRNHATYRARLREVTGPCLPFLGLILTDITFTADGNPDTRPSLLAPEMQLINQDKYVKLGKIAMDFKRYQEPFNFHELEAVQTFLEKVLAERGSGSLDALYRKSLLLEPRVGTERLSSAVEKPGWLGGRI